MDVLEAAKQIQVARRRQDTQAVLALVSAALAQGDATAPLVLEAARAQLSAGLVHQAQEWIDKARGLVRRHDEAVILDLEQAQIGVFRALDLSLARGEARRIQLIFRERAEPMPADVEWLSTRLLLVAAIYWEIGPAEIGSIRRGLGKLQGRLMAAGQVDQAHAVAFSRAERVSWPWSIQAWDTVAAMGRRDGNLATTGDALLRRAAQMRTNDASLEDIEAALDAAQSAYVEMDHKVGPLAVECERALIAIECMQEPLERLERCIAAFLAAGRPKEALSTLLDLSTRAHRTGNRRMAERSLERIAEIAQESGHHAAHMNIMLAHADLALRERDDARARDLCEQALAENMPAFARAGLLAIRASAFSFAGDRMDAVADRRAAIALYESLGAEADASDLVAALAADIAGTRLEADLDAANAVLVEWICRDQARTAERQAAQKTVERAGLCVLRALGRRARSERQSEEPALIAEAEAHLQVAERAFEPGRTKRSVPQAELSAFIGKVAQTRAQMATLANDTKMMLGAQEKALLAYEQVGMPYEAANCRYLIGCLLLNQSNAAPPEQAAAIAAQAEDNLGQALHYYEDIAGMRLQAAQTRHKLAMLYLNMQHVFIREVADRLCAQADEFLTDAANDFDILRQAFQANTRLSSFSTKSARSAEAAEIHREALRLHLDLRVDPRKAWEWTVRSKARALNDMLGAESMLPPDAAAAAQADPRIKELIALERRLADDLATANAARRLDLRPRLAGLRERMRQEPALEDYVALRSGAPAGPDDLAAVGALAPGPFALVDWISVHGGLFLLVARPGEEPAIERLPLGLHQVETFVTSLLGPRTFRETLRYDAAVLEELAGLVAPLEWLTRAGEHLILCPTGALHHVPLEALLLKGQALLERNPLAYAPSLAVLRLACQPSEGGGAGVAVFGDPTSDRADALRAAQGIARSLGAAPRLGPEASRAAFETALAEAHLVHFQGHAIHDPKDPLGSYLRLSDGPLEARRLFEMQKVKCRMIQLGACESATLQYRPGDEPFGLISALLIAGIRAVTAASWNAHETSAGLFMDKYVNGLISGSAPILALQQAAMAVRAREMFSKPYYWAPFRLYGNPWRRAMEMETNL